MTKKFARRPHRKCAAVVLRLAGRVCVVPSSGRERNSTSSLNVGSTQVIFLFRISSHILIFIYI